ncbi:hypothetical protein LZZ85_20930 [Terrimonas sp. NA20]|uniref:Redox-active disulfide protein 2 n=1 Tax=Terrimonas ginsenosidimutans TaxID=2908004 RepID=A0ABS9KWP3_9BACT|nr:hypothetical protein [Terrimonas ginsenosidimutans]MCG2616777.1 hypothetical protein [Terrimonas ginsenosidimutans]
MNKNSFSKMTTDQLLKRRSILKILINMCLVAAAILLCTVIYLIIAKQKFNVLVFLPLSMGSLVLVNVNTLNMIKKELKARGL